MFNLDKPLERCNAEKEVKPGNRSNLWLSPGAHEKGTKKNFIYPYQEPRKVPLAEKAKTSQDNSVKGIRQISPVPSV